jgi:hypothetical protein
MLEAATTAETSVNIYQTTRRTIPEHSRLHAGDCSYSVVLNIDQLNNAYFK